MCDAAEKSSITRNERKASTNTRTSSEAKKAGGTDIGSIPKKTGTGSSSSVKKPVSKPAPKATTVASKPKPQPRKKTVWERFKESKTARSVNDSRGIGGIVARFIESLYIKMKAPAIVWWIASLLFIVCGGVKFLSTWARAYSFWCICGITGTILAYAVIVKIFENAKRACATLLAVCAIIFCLWPTYLGAPGLIKEITLVQSSDAFDFVNEGEEINVVIKPVLCRRANTNFIFKKGENLDGKLSAARWGYGVKVESIHKQSSFSRVTAETRSLYPQTKLNYMIDNTSNCQDLSRDASTENKLSITINNFNIDTMKSGFTMAAKLIYEDGEPVTWASAKVVAIHSDGRETTLAEYGKFAVLSGRFWISHGITGVKDVKGFRLYINVENRENKKILTQYQFWAG